MKYTFIGTGAADWPINQPAEAVGIRRMTSSLVDESLLIDCGPDSFGYFNYLGKDPSKITDVIISHGHGDHLNFYELEKYAKASGKIRLWCDKGVELLFKNNNISIPEVELHFLQPYEYAQVGEYKVFPLLANHYEIETEERPLHYIIEKDGKKLFYGCDGSMFLGRTWYYLRSEKLDCAILDCTSGDFLDDIRFGTHNSIPMVLMIVEAMRQRGILEEGSKAVASHLARTLHTTHEETSKFFDEHNIITAYDGMELTV